MLGITPCSLLKVNRPSGETYRLHLQGRIINWARNQRERKWQAELFSRWFFPLPWRRRRHVPPKRRRLTFNTVRIVVFQKIGLFILTVVRTSNPNYQQEVSLPLDWKKHDRLRRYEGGGHVAGCMQQGVLKPVMQVAAEPTAVCRIPFMSLLHLYILTCRQWTGNDRAG
jgi:hypothetical protein